MVTLALLPAVRDDSYGNHREVAGYDHCARRHFRQSELVYRRPADLGAFRTKMHRRPAFPEALRKERNAMTRRDRLWRRREPTIRSGVLLGSPWLRFSPGDP